jgi:hypothetical protein
MSGILGNSSTRRQSMKSIGRGWLFDLLVGGVIGVIAGAVAAVNLVIYVGIEDGYEATIVEVFAQSPVVGVVTVGVLLAGPIVGVLLARRIRRRRISAIAEV